VSDTAKRLAEKIGNAIWGAGENGGIAGPLDIAEILAAQLEPLVSAATNVRQMLG
jgi:hypothetical protein